MSTSEKWTAREQFASEWCCVSNTFFQTENIKTFQTASINFDIPVPCTSEIEFQEKGPKTQIFVHHTVDASGKLGGKGSDETEPP